MLLSTVLILTFGMYPSTQGDTGVRSRGGQDLEAIASAAHGRVGAAAMLLETGESIGRHENERFPMQSVYKVPIAMAVLDQVERGSLTLNEKVPIRERDLVPPGVHSPIRDRYPHGGVDLSLRELIRLAVAESDGSASDILMRVAGGPGRITAYLRGLGVGDMTVTTTEMEMSRGPRVQYRNSTSPREAVVLLRALWGGRGISASGRALLLEFMTETTIGPKRLKGRLPQGTVVAHKTGSSSTVDGVAAATNDMGIITLPNGRHAAVAVFVSDATADEATREAVIANIGRAVWDRWSSGGRDSRMPAGRAAEVQHR